MGEPEGEQLGDEQRARQHHGMHRMCVASELSPFLEIICVMGYSRSLSGALMLFRANQHPFEPKATQVAMALPCGNSLDHRNPRGSDPALAGRCVR